LIVAAFWNSNSASAKIIKDCLKGKYKLVYSPEIYRETMRVLENIKVKRHYWSRIEALFKKGMVVKSKRKIHVVKEDPEDNKYLECAESSQANYILSNDYHLLKLKSFKATRLLRPSQFLEERGSQNEQKFFY